MNDDPFKPLDPPATKPKLRVVAGDAGSTIVMPIPGDAPAPLKRHEKLGAPSARWVYLDASGRRLGEILRFEREDGGKEFRPLSLWRNAKGALIWSWVSWPEPRPLYGLERLAARPDAPVLIAEGEKSADAAGRLLPGFVAMCSPNGSNSAAKADWTPLRGRRVAIWPDADAAGAKYLEAVAAALAEIGAASVTRLAPPDGVKPGWDAADAEGEGWKPAAAEAWAAAFSASETTSSEASAGAKRPKRGAGAITAMIEDSGAEFWHDQMRDAYATVTIDGHRENYRLNSTAFAQWIASLADRAGMVPPSRNALADTIRVFEARALHRGPERSPFKRVGERGGKVYIDLGDRLWRVIEVDGSGWRILSSHDLPIIRSNAMRPLCEPEETDGSLGILRRFVNADDDGFKLIVAWCLAALYPPGGYPVLILHGEQGSAKSSLTEILRNLIDANFAPKRSLPREESDLMIAATHSHILALDNVSSINGEISDALCRISTGGGFGARTKFTDGDEFLIYAKNPILINGIPALAGRPDLASRALIVRLNPISDDARLTEDELSREWAAVAPRVLGILLDVLSSALRRLPETRPAAAGRMADFERLMEAASLALEWEEGEFAEVYLKNQVQSDDVTIENDLVAGALVMLIEDDYRNGFACAAKRLLELLETKVSDATRRSHAWPANEVALGMRIARLKPILRRRGITVEKKHSGDRQIRVSVDASALWPKPPRGAETENV